ncbi:MAG: tyrosine-type recombinase/integrase [Microthrixaceae bacterium]
MRKLPSKRYQASYVGPDTVRHSAPSTFSAKIDAEGWLRDEKRLIEAGTWTSPADRITAAHKPVTFGEYSAAWLADRTLKPRTRAHYARLLDRQLLPAFAEIQLKAITPHKVRAWHTGLGISTPTLRAHAYGLLRTVLGDAVRDGEIAANPCHIRGAGNSRRVHKIKPASLAELKALAAAMPEKYRLMVMLAAWCGLRFGELTELRRRDVDLTNAVLHVRRAVVRVEGGFVVGTPKSDAGTRDVNVPPHLLPMLKDHLGSNSTPGKNGLLFPASDGTSHLAPSTIYRSFYPAREAAGRPDLRFHDLRHTGAVLAASTGATLAELMARLGHSTAGAALRYQHAAQDRDKVIAAALSDLARSE